MAFWSRREALYTLKYSKSVNLSASVFKVYEPAGTILKLNRYRMIAMSSNSSLSSVYYQMLFSLCHS